jgi:hypothetical protein
MIDEDLRNKVLKILEEEQERFIGVLEPQTGLTVPATNTIIESERAPDGTLSEKVIEQPSNYVNESIEYQYRTQFGRDAETLYEFCKIVDDKIISINAQINVKKQELVSLSTQATSGGCWPGIGFSSNLFNFTDYRTITLIRGDIDNLKIYPNIAGPTVRYDVENPFEPDQISRLTSQNSGYGYGNLQDPVFYKNKDGTLSGINADGSGDLIGNGRFDISETESDHSGRLIAINRTYSGSNIPAATCVGIGTSIRQIYDEIIQLRIERDSLREDLNIIKDNKSQKELSAWGVKKLDQQILQKQTENSSAIAAVKAFNSDVTVNIDATVLSLDVGDPDSYSGIGTIWYDRSGNGNNVTLFPTTSTATYEYSDGYYLTFNGTDQYAQTGIKTTNILGVGNTWTAETWFKVNGVPYDNFVGIVTTTGDIGITSTAIVGIVTDGISIGQYVRTNNISGIVGSATTVVGIATTNGGTVYIQPPSSNTQNFSSVSFTFGTYSPLLTSSTNAIIDLNADSTKTNLLSVTHNQDGIFAGVATGRLVYTTSETGISTTHLVGTAITNGYWYHGVVVRNDTENTKLYINGNLVSTYTGNFPLGTASTTSVKIAAWTDELVYSNVSISVAKVYQKSYTDDEIKNKFDASKGRYGLLG